MAGSSEKVRVAFDEGRLLDVVRAAKTRKNPEDKLLSGISLYKLGRNGEALEVLGKVSDQAHSLVKSMFYLALIHRQHGDDDLAMACLEKYLAFYPDDDEAKDLLEARKAVREELMKEPSVDLARVYAQQGHFEQALDIYTQVDHLGVLDEAARRDAMNVQNHYLMKTLESWLVRLKK
ncbi:MAG: tetratricopeptide repeat protein [Desulfobacterota bacterium]|nr:tetratricopeptide repeat protein [Thermodesulfobacteriota bacterium]